MAAVKDGHQLWLVIFAVICAAISAIYYFRVIQAIYFKEPVPGVNDNIQVTSSFKWLLLITAGLIILLGILPGLVIDWLYF
jgi:NADH-quinone oxidoreductase subunit N